ncbi:MAG: ABC transporter permease [Actinomycetota bacterium]|nr:ABC transporter permease [Actinomycetota bacterium]
MSTIELTPDAVPSGGPSPAEPHLAGGRSLWHNATGTVGLCIVVSLALAAVLAPVLAPYDPNAVDLSQRFDSPSLQHPLGTDGLGRDVLSRLLYGGRLSIGSTVVAALGISTIGLALGLLAGYLGGLTDTVISRTIDALLAFPAFLVALALTGLLGRGLPQVTVAVVAVGWVTYARVARSVVLAERERAYVDAARALGASRVRILVKHLLPNVIGPLVVLTTLELGAILLGISGLSFLRLSVRPPTAEWGSMLAEASTSLGRAPYLMVSPGLAIFLMVLGFNLLGDGLRDVLGRRPIPRR